MSELRTQFMDKSKRLYRMTRQQTTGPPIGKTETGQNGEEKLPQF